MRRHWLAFRLWCLMLLAWLRDEWAAARPAARAVSSRPRGGAVLLRKIAGLGLCAFLVGSDAASTWHSAGKAGTALLLLRHRIQAAAEDAPVTGDYDFLSPRNTTPPVGITWNPVTGMYEGSVMDTSAPTPVTTVTLTDTGVPVTNLANLNTAIATAASSATGNVRIEIPKTALLDGTIMLKAKPSADFWTEVVTVDRAGLPTLTGGLVRGTYANRVSQADTAHMPECYTSLVNDSALANENGAKKYYIRGLNFTNRSNVFHYNLTSFAPTSGELTSANYPEDIILAQCCFHGGTYGDNAAKRAVYFRGRRMAVVDCFFDHIGTPGSDPQDINIANGQGPFKIHNNYLCASGAAECVLTGGDGMPGNEPTFIPHDIEITGNFLDHRDEGGNKPYVEIKVGVRVLIDGNECGFHNGLGQQVGILIRLTDQGGGNTFTDTSDVICTNNRGLESVGGIGVANAAFMPVGYLYNTRRVHIANNLFHHRPDVTIGYGNTFQSSSSSQDQINIVYNTFIGRYVNPYAKVVQLINDPGAGGTLTHWHMDHNVLAAESDEPAYYDEFNVSGGDWPGDIGVVGFGEAMLDYCMAADGSTFEANMVTVQTGRARWVRQLAAGPTIAGAGFVDPATNQWQLAPSAVGYRAGPQGQDLGHQKTLLDAHMARVRP